MVGTLGAYTAVVILVFIGSILLSFRSRQDFVGVGTGIALAAAITYLARNFIWGISQGVV